MKLFFTLAIFIATSFHVAAQQAQSWEQLSEEAFRCVLRKEHAKSIEYGKAALQLAETQFGKAHIKYGTSLLNLANLHKDYKVSRRHQTQAEGYYQQVFQFFLKNATLRGHVVEGHLYNNYAIYIEQVGQNKDPKPFYRNAYLIYKNNLGESHKLTQTAKSKISL